MTEVSKIAKDPEKLYDLLESTAKESNDHTQLPNLSEMAEMLGWSRNTVRKICENDERFKEITEKATNSKYESGRIFIPKKMDTSQFMIGGRIQEQIEETRKELKERILRQPTIEEVAEEMRREPDEFFRELYRKSVSEEWRAPSKEQKDKAAENLQNMIEEALPAFLQWTKDRCKPDGTVNDYIESQKEALADIEITGRKELDNEMEKLWISAPPKLGKFMAEPDFTIIVNPRQDPRK